MYIVYTFKGQCAIFRYISHQQTAKGKASLHLCAD